MAFSGPPTQLVGMSQAGRGMRRRMPSSLINIDRLNFSTVEDAYRNLLPALVKQGDPFILRKTEHRLNLQLPGRPAVSAKHATPEKDAFLELILRAFDATASVAQTLPPVLDTALALKYLDLGDVKRARLPPPPPQVVPPQIKRTLRFAVSTGLTCVFRPEDGWSLVDLFGGVGGV
ncbi:hypothetical protein JCM6882_004890 [Rhodosporidiobolus microsporus]